jgi:hypothetical protein
MTRVAKENQGLETTFVDLESADEDQINRAIRDDTKVCLSVSFAFKPPFLPTRP